MSRLRSFDTGLSKERLSSCSTPRPVWMLPASCWPRRLQMDGLQLDHAVDPALRRVGHRRAAFPAIGPCQDFRRTCFTMSSIS
jgi:hypothetical protein